MMRMEESSVALLLKGRDMPSLMKEQLLKVTHQYSYFLIYALSKGLQALWVFDAVLLLVTF